jgi:XTP/dITP diphosphohydrolase
MERLVIASNNKGKINEIKKILRLPIEVVSMKEAGFDVELIESGETFSENALQKAKCLFEFVGGCVIADDSGLVIDYLNGAPGVYSARFAGENTSQQQKNQKIINMLKGVNKELRTARFICSIAFVSRDISFTVEGSVEGLIAEKPEGEQGFGYDPIFYLPEFQKTMAQLTEQEKNRISHRARALNKLRYKLETIYNKPI